MRCQEHLKGNLEIFQTKEFVATICWLTPLPLLFSRNLEIYMVSKARVVADDSLADPPSSFTDRLD